MTTQINAGSKVVALNNNSNIKEGEVGIVTSIKDQYVQVKFENKTFCLKLHEVIHFDDFDFSKNEIVNDCLSRQDRILSRLSIQNKMVCEMKALEREEEILRSNLSKLSEKKKKFNSLQRKIRNEILKLTRIKALTDTAIIAQLNETIK